MMVGTLTDDDNILEIEYVAMPEDYDRYLPIVNQLISSFRFTGDQLSSEEPPGEEMKMETKRRKQVNQNKQDPNSIIPVNPALLNMINSSEIHYAIAFHYNLKSANA